MKIKEVIQHLERKFPLHWQEDFDNSGIQCGDKERTVTGVMVCFDMSEKVLDEAIAKNCNMVIAHHPLIYRADLKRIEPNNRIGKILFKAIENKLFLYSMHTNIDSGIGGGNDLFSEKLGLTDVKVLSPKKDMFKKLVVYVPFEQSNQLKEKLFEAGAGQIGKYEQCSYNVEGYGTFLPLEGSQPAIGNVGKIEEVKEERVEMIFPAHLQSRIVKTVYANHPYEEPAFDIFKLENEDRSIGLGRVGVLPEPMEVADFLQFAKDKLQLNVIKYSGKIDRKIRTVAVCGGGGSSYIKAALQANADIYVTGDLKYHDFFIPENKMILADIGHFEGENFIREIIYNEVSKNFTNFASYISEQEKLEIHFI